MIIILQIAGYLVLLWLLTWVGNHAIRLVLALSKVRKVPPPKDATPSQATAAEEPVLNAGRYIGILERILIAIGILLHSWEVIAGVVALKSVARYQELDKQLTAEYFLLGSLVSILWAILVSGAAIWFDANWGLNIFASLTGAMASP